MIIIFKLTTPNRQLITTQNSPTTNLLLICY
nr:MAG TPA: hypothetical protein [Caudoviricetes sp.]